MRKCAGIEKGRCADALLEILFFPSIYSIPHFWLFPDYVKPPFWYEFSNVGKPDSNSIARAPAVLGKADAQKRVRVAP